LKQGEKISNLENASQNLIHIPLTICKKALKRFSKDFAINKFEAAIHGLYLCMKIPGPQGTITVYGNQQAARNIERDFIPGQRNIHCLTAQREVLKSASPTAKEHDKAQLQSNDGTKTVPLDKATPKQTVTISEDLTSHDEERLLCCLSKNKDVFAWSTLDLVGVSRSIIEHSLGIDPSVRPKKQRLRKMSDEKTDVGSMLRRRRSYKEK
jgi:hypothetical protein